jgi:hypothetical protein
MKTDRIKIVHVIVVREVGWVQNMFFIIFWKGRSSIDMDSLDSIQISIYEMHKSSLSKCRSPFFTAASFSSFLRIHFSVLLLSPADFHVFLPVFISAEKVNRVRTSERNLVLMSTREHK